MSFSLEILGKRKYKLIIVMMIMIIIIIIVNNASSKIEINKYLLLCKMRGLAEMFIS